MLLPIVCARVLPRQGQRCYDRPGIRTRNLRICHNPASGVIIVPAFNGQVPALPHNQETRDFLCEQFTEMGNHAAQNGTTVIFEPLNRKECFYMRQVADAASVCRDINNPGVRCMGDFWHMTWEETSDMGAFISGGDYLQHVHVASRKRRSMPGEDGEADNYVDGFKGLKMLGYDKYVSFECGCQGDRNIIDNLCRMECLQLPLREIFLIQKGVDHCQQEIRIQLIFVTDRLHRFIAQPEADTEPVDYRNE